MKTSENGTGANREIVVIDDDLSFLRSVSRLLRVNGYRVSAHSSPLEFLACPPKTPPDCFIVDMHMPDMTGIDFLEQLSPRHISAPSILVTANDTPQTRQAAQRLGVYALLSKPFEGQVLLNAVKLLLAPGPSHADINLAPSSSPDY